MAYEAAPSALTLPELQGVVTSQSFGLGAVVIAGHPGAHEHAASLAVYKPAEGVISDPFFTIPPSPHPGERNIALSAHSHPPEYSGWALPTPGDLEEFAGLHERVPGVIGAVAMTEPSGKGVEVIVYRAGSNGLLSAFANFVTSIQPDILEVCSQGGLRAAWLNFTLGGILKASTQAESLAKLYK